MIPLRFSYVFKKKVMNSVAWCLYMYIPCWDFFFPLHSVAEITQIESSAWFEFNHLFRFNKADIGKLVHFSF